MTGTRGFIWALLFAGLAWGAEKSRLDFARVPLSFEPNLGQGDTGARFVAKSPGYTLLLYPAGARFQFHGRDKSSVSLGVDLQNADRHAAIMGESPLPGKANYFPASDPKTWVTDVPTYSRVRYNGIYSGVDVVFYGAANRLEYDFVIQPGADPGQIRMKLTGSDPTVNVAGELVLPLAQGAKGDLRFLKPLVYQISGDGKTREWIDARYSVKKRIVTFALGRYDHGRQLIIDPVVALSYSQYLSDYVSSVAVDSSGNSYVTGTMYSSGFYVTKFNPSGTVVYNATIGTGYYVDPYAIAVGSSGEAYVAGVFPVFEGGTLPISPNAYQSTANAYTSAFLAVLSANGSAVPYATYLSGSADTYNAAQGLAIDSSGDAYVAGYTYDSTFPTTNGAYQTTFAGSYTGFVAKINPVASTGPLSLVYSTFLGQVTTELYAIAVDSSGDAYVTGNASTGFPVTAGAFQYSGLYAADGGVYVTELNPLGAALVYSAYLGYGTGYGIAVEGEANPSAYVTGTVSGVDFPTTTGAYQTEYAGAFVTKLSSNGSTEVYSTFLGGPSSYAANGNVFPSSIALPNGCASSCNAYVAGWTSTTDFPLIDAIQTAPSNTGNSGFVTEIAATGASALFSSYLNGVSSGIYPPYYYYYYEFYEYGNSPSIAVDSSGNMSVVANIYGTSDFPITISSANPTAAVLARIVPATAPFVVPYPAAVVFGSQPVGVSTSIYSGASTVRLGNFSGTAATLSPIQVSPPTVFSESDNCGGSIPAGGYCTLTLNFTPNAPSTWAGTVTITSNASDSPTTIALSGTGYDTAFVQPSQSSLTFGNQAVGASSTAQTVTVSNLGDQTTALNIYVGTSNFSSVNNCPSQLLPGANCTASVTFSPTQAGLLTDTLTISSSVGPSAYVSISGTGTVAGGTSAVTLSAASLQFAPQAVSTTSTYQLVYVTNNGAVPIVVQSYAASGDFTVSNYNCASLPFQLNPQSSCPVQVTFSPTTTGSRTGTLTFTDSATGSPQTVALSGTGLASTENVEFYPSSSVSFPDTPVGITAGYQLIYYYNTGTVPITVDRVLVSGPFSIYETSCEATTVAGVPVDGTGSGGNCYVYVYFTPTTTGPQTGTLTFTDSAPGSPHVVNLTGNGITATGTISLLPTGLNFATQADGTTTSQQNILFTNPGNTPVTVTAFSFSGTNAADYSLSPYNCPAVPFVVPAGDNYYCYQGVQFTPGATGTRTATLTVASSAGNFTVGLSGTGVAASQAIGLTPTSMNLGSIVVGQSGPNEYVYIRNTGTEAVTFTANPKITGTNPAVFVNNNEGCATNGYSLAPASSCYIYVSFAPTSAGAKSATLTFTDSAGTQTLALSGTGVSSTPTIALSDYLISYNMQVQGTTSPLGNYIYLYNNRTTALALGNIAITGPFVLPNGYNTCNGQTIAAGSQCYTYVEFAPTSAGYSTGTLTFNNSSGTALSGVPVVPLAGYGVAQTYTAYINPTATNFPGQQVIGTTASDQVVYLYNSGNTSLTVGTVTGTNFGGTNEFSVAGANGGYDGCSGQTVTAGSNCEMEVVFTPSAAGARTGTMSFPVTYFNNTTATFTENLSGIGGAEVDSAVLTPPNASFVDQAVGTTAYPITVYLNNSGNQPFNVGTLTNTNVAEFSTAGYDGCSGTTVPVGSYCSLGVTFTPSGTGAQTGSITFPVTFADKATASPKLALTGTGVASAKALQITPAGIQFPAEIQTLTSNARSITVTNTGNVAVTIGTDSISTNSAEFEIDSDNCAGTNLAPTGACSIQITFTPSASATGTQTGALKIADNATGGPHTVALSGTAITAAQQIVLSQTALAFGNQPAGSTSSAQLVYFTNQSDSSVNFTSIALGGTNAADFTFTNGNCNESYYPARSNCYISVQFIPPTGASGALTATITEMDSATPGTHTITLTGTAVAPGPAAALSPSTLTFPTQNVGTTSAVQYFSVTNTGSANLTISAVTSTNAAEFPVYSDGCSGTSLTPNQHCVVGVKFSPTLGGSRTGTIQVSDNAAGSPQSLAVTGTGYGIPSASFNPTSLAFGNVDINVTSAKKTITLSNTGTDTLVISSISFKGANAGLFKQTDTCPASLAPTGSCVISVSFTPTAVGTVGADLAVTDNANNAGGSVQVATVSGTGVAVPTATAAPGTLTFASTNIGATSAAQSATLTNSGTGPLTITSITIGGPNSADYAESNNCGESLVAATTCTISVTFTPAATGTLTATITITDNANNVSGTTQTVNLTGAGAGVPAAAVAPSTVVFPNQNVATASGAQTVTLSNSGTAVLTIASIAISGTNASDFAASNNCAGSVAAGSNCLISVTFTPGAPGSRSGVLMVTDNAGNVNGSTQTAALTGTGIGVPTAGVNPSSLTFASTVVGVASSPQTVTLSNTGSGPLTITSIVIGGENPTDFGETTTCGTTLPVGSNCSISVTFTPAATGALTANLHVIDNSGNTGSTQTVTLSGTGATASGPPTVVSIAPTSGIGQTQTFTMVYSDPNGISDLSQVLVLFNTSTSLSSACAVVYKPGTNQLYLYNNAGTALTTGITPGSGSVSNSQCTLTGSGSSVTTSGNNLTLNAALTFAGSYGGAKSSYLEAVGNTQNSGWVLEGTWTPTMVVSLSPASGTGLSQTFTTVYSDPNGVSDLSAVRLLFNTSLNVTSACYVEYSPATNKMYLYNDAGTAWLSTAVVPGSSTSVSNSQCTLDGTGSSFSTSGNNLTLNVALTFTGTFTGLQNVYMEAVGKTQTSTWVGKGTWTP
jgi:Abnormal spindle-like microcephaly-assoc'd, ASPM-SPD-2-Hydin/Beta-propeller repeat